MSENSECQAERTKTMSGSECICLQPAGFVQLRSRKSAHEVMLDMLILKEDMGEIT